MFYEAENSSSVKPEEIEYDKYCVFIRKDFEYVEEVKTEHQERPAHWKYLEDKIPNDNWNTYLTAKGAMDLVEALEG